MEGYKLAKLKDSKEFWSIVAHGSKFTTTALSSHIQPAVWVNYFTSHYACGPTLGHEEEVLDIALPINLWQPLEVTLSDTVAAIKAMHPGRHRALIKYRLICFTLNWSYGALILIT